MRRTDMARAARLTMTQLQLDGMENHLPRSLSLGQRRRVELGRALIHRPDLLVWDGITDGLDLPAVRDIFAVLRVAAAGARADPDRHRQQHPRGIGDRDRVAVLDRGHLQFDGTREALQAALTERLELRYVIEGRA
jgi:ABC-type Na+ transport system ATPase subunit NatA